MFSKIIKNSMKHQKVSEAMKGTKICYLKPLYVFKKVSKVYKTIKRFQKLISNLSSITKMYLKLSEKF